MINSKISNELRSSNVESKFTQSIINNHNIQN